jgi:hypothetical protein
MGMNYSVRNFFYIIASSVFFYGCAPLVENISPAKISLKMPKSDLLKRSTSSIRTQKTTGENPTIFGQADITSLDDIDCYVVLVAHAKSGKSGNCTGDFLYEEIKLASATVPDGAEVVINDVPTGIDVKLLVMGMRNHDASEFCPDFTRLSADEMANLSRPLVVGITDEVLKAQTENIIDIEISFTSAQTINGCSDGPISWGAGGVYGAAQFGSAQFGP